MKTNCNKKDRWDSGKPRPPNKHLFVTSRKVVILLLAKVSIPYRYPTTENLSDLDFDLSRSLKGKSDGVIGLAIYGFLLMVNSNILPNLAPLWDIRFWNLSDLDFDLSRSLKVKSHGAIRLGIYGFLLIVNSNIGPNLAPLRDMRLWNLSDLDLTFQGHSMSKVMVSLDLPYMISYWWLIVT